MYGFTLNPPCPSSRLHYKMYGEAARDASRVAVAAASSFGDRARVPNALQGPSARSSRGSLSLVPGECIGRGPRALRNKSRIDIRLARQAAQVCTCAEKRKENKDKIHRTVCLPSLAFCIPLGDSFLGRLLVRFTFLLSRLPPANLANSLFAREKEITPFHASL